MKTEPDQFPEEELDDWYRHPSTIAKVKYWMGRQLELRQLLFRACSSSTDPQVRAAYQDYICAEQTIATLTPKKKETNGNR